MNTWDYIERVRAANGGDACTDYRISKLLLTSTSVLSNYKSGLRGADDEIAARIADLLGEPPAAVIADLRATRAEAEGNQVMANIWRNVEAMALGKTPPVVRKVSSPIVRVQPMRKDSARPAVASSAPLKQKRSAACTDGLESVAVASGGLKIRRGNPS